MASSIGTFTRFRSFFFCTSTVKQYACNTPRRIFSTSFSAHGQSRSSLFEHIKEGYSDKPELDMRRVCEHTDQVITELENRKGDLKAIDVQAIISAWKQLKEVRKKINELEENKKMISEKVRALVVKEYILFDLLFLSFVFQLMAYKSLREEGRKIRAWLSQLYTQQSDIEKEYYCLALRLPNRTHPDVPIGDESQAKVVEMIGHKAGHRSYYLRGAGAQLQMALQNFALELLQKRVEMFGVTEDETGQESSQLLNEFVLLQKEIFSSLNLHFRVLDMPTQELGAPAFRKYDIEAWMPGRESYGEISSASNCTDYQSRRLNILYERNDGSLKYAHTVNATACAIPRTIIALLETHQTKEGTVLIPEVLQPYLGLKVIEKPLYTPVKYIGPNQPHRTTYSISKS
ncbi:Serine--tRNA ligase, mitochondrial [Bagarius yarrelli]|uniref:serine--tRNA ligase n=1 Tax=Bagarius yarrelli TaxID=175774 RepID=A0A556V826_BAGYA|nr:Serine--tRNA ligase, mitochondrial [Bagarius yarrelli]